MDLLTPDIRAVLLANAAASSATDDRHDPAPVVKLFNPVGAATWLATELDSDGDILFGLADLGFGCPELGYFSLSEIASVRLPFGLGIERDIGFASTVPLSVWTDTARRAGSILSAQRLLRAVERHRRAGQETTEARGDPAAPRHPPDPDELPPSPKEDG